ncbi:hypothetical protein ACFLVX_00735 [Chloroflexota bacterium]
MRWDTADLANCAYETMRLVHVFLKKSDEEKAIARENIVEVTVEN